MQEWILVKELNEKVSHLEEAAKVLKEDAVAKEEAVVKLEGQLEILKKDRLEDQRKVLALKLELEEEKKRCKDLEMTLRRSSQSVQPPSRRIVSQVWQCGKSGKHQIGIGWRQT